jgi:hypothetical protein
MIPVAKAKRGDGYGEGDGDPDGTGSERVPERGRVPMQDGNSVLICIATGQSTDYSVVD